MIVLAVLNDQFEAGRIHSLLEAKGFHPEPLGVASHLFAAGGGKDFTIRVPKEEAKRAAELLESEGLGKFIWR
ncbi:MAG: DUF2007 domain-containing protein [Planctomycetota bacterium]